MSTGTAPLLAVLSSKPVNSLSYSFIMAGCMSRTKVKLTVSQYVKLATVVGKPSTDMYL